MTVKTAFIRTALLLLTLLPATGCFREDYSFCPPDEDNVRLDFRLFSGESFKSKVTSVSIGIFDAKGNYLRTETVGRNAIAEHEGTVVTLAPGDYRMVFWANMNGNTIINGLGTDLPSPRMTYSRMTGTPPVTGNGDPLYYAPYGQTRADEAPQEYYRLTVPKHGEYTDVVWFTHAHRSLEIYVKGLSNSPELPTVEVTGLPAGLKYFGMKSLVSDPQKVIASERTSLVEQDNIIYAAAMFDTFLFTDMEQIDIVIKDSNGTEIYRTPLTDAIEESSADPTKIAIRLIFSIMNGDVEVSIPGWKSGETGVDLGK